MKTLILAEENTDYEFFKTLPDDEHKVISFDIVSHKRLESLGIKHELIEDYFEEDDPRLIDENTIRSCLEWYKQKHCEQLLQFENLNLGWLLEIELFSFMVQIIKKFVGLIRLVTNEKPTQIFCSKLLSLMIEEIEKSNKITLKIITTVSSPSLHFDIVEIPINVGGKLIPIRISRNSALKIKKTMESFTNLFFNLKADSKNNKESLVLLDFNPLMYEDMLQELAKLPYEILLLNERRPAAWNLKALKVLKKLNCKVVVLDDFLDQASKNEIAIKQEKLNKNLTNLFNADDAFKEFFAVLGLSFWPSIRDYFVLSCRTRFNEAITRLILTAKFIQNSKIKHVVTMYNTGFEEKTMLFQFQKHNIPGILLQHGYLPRGSYVKNRYLPISPIIPQTGIKNAVWGNFTKQLLIDLGVSGENIHVTGSPRHDKFFKIKSNPKRAKTILFVDSFANEVDFVSFDTRNYLKNEQTIKQIITILHNFKNYNLVVKLHPGQHALPYSIKSVIQEIDSSIPIYQSGDISKFLKESDLIIASELTTAILESMIMNIPTMLYLSHPYWSVEERIFQNKASVLVKTPTEFKNEIDKLLNDPSYRADIIKNAQFFITEQFSAQGSACNKFSEIFSN